MAITTLANRKEFCRICSLSESAFKFYMKSNEFCSRRSSPTPQKKEVNPLPFVISGTDKKFSKRKVPAEIKEF